MPLINMTDMLQHAYRYNYAVGAFGVAGWDMLGGIVEAAETMRSPIILSLSRTYPGTDHIEPLALAVAGIAQRASIPIAFQVEVEDDLNAVAEAIKTGCGGVVFNASQHNFPDNVTLTRKAVDLATPHGVMVVGELANLDNGEAPESAMGKSTSPIEARHYVERTGVTCLAVSVSRTEHGSAKHDFSRLAKINQTLDIPLGIHGGGGLSDDQFRRMINSGATKINYSTPLFDVIAQRIHQNARTPDTGYAELVEQTRDAIRIEVERCIRLWGCGGRAAEILQQSRGWRPHTTSQTETAASAAASASSNASPVFASNRR